jgi:Flp pilus assembly pilin Flp
MSRILKSLTHIAHDESGGEVIEYAIVAGLISIAAIAVIGAFGSKVLARWNSVNSSL